MYSDVRDQVYKGSSARTTLGDFAVDETRGSVLLHGKKIATIYFHASCGGVLEAAENVWSGQAQPYLLSTQDVIGKQFADSESPYFRWEHKRSAGQLDTLFKNSFGVSYASDVVTDTIDIPFTVGGGIKSVEAVWTDL